MEHEISLQTILMYIEQANPTLVAWAVEKAKNDLLQAQLFELQGGTKSDPDEDEKSDEITK